MSREHCIRPHFYLTERCWRLAVGIRTASSRARSCSIQTRIHNLLPSSVGVLGALLHRARQRAASESPPLSRGRPDSWNLIDGERLDLSAQYLRTRARFSCDGMSSILRPPLRFQRSDGRSHQIVPDGDSVSATDYGRPATLHSISIMLASHQRRHSNLLSELSQWPTRIR